MKIIQIINSLGTGGAEKLLLETLPLYRQAGIEMDLLLLWDNNQPFTKTLREINCCKVIVLNKSENESDIYSIFNILRLRRYLKEYDIAHVHLFPSLYFVRIASLGLTTKLVYTEHCTENRRIKSKLWRFFDLWCYRGYSSLVFISDEIKEIFLNYLKRTSNFKVIQNGVNLKNIFNATSILKNTLSEHIQEKDILLIQVSGFREQKDPDTLIKAINYLPSNYKLVLVGDGDRKSKLEHLVEVLDFKKRVIFAGLRMDVPNLLKTADLIILSSKYEGLSLSSIEGMASGKPFLASNVPGLQDVVEGAGVLFEQGNSKELAKKIIELVDNPILYEQVAKACQERAKCYDIQKMVDNHINMYKEIIY